MAKRKPKSKPRPKKSVYLFDPVMRATLKWIYRDA